MLTIQSYLTASRTLELNGRRGNWEEKEGEVGGRFGKKTKTTTVVTQQAMSSNR